MNDSGRFDVIVAGVGGMGSAAVYHLARRGARVLGLERFDIPNNLGSSHGVNRIIRLAYFEHPKYVPLLRRAYELWRRLQLEADEELLYITGSLDVGGSHSRVFEGAVRSSQEHNLPYEVLDSAEVARRFPGYRLSNDLMAVWQPEGGFLLSERCIVAHVALAQSLGAEVHAREAVLEWETTSNGVRVQTERGQYEADHLVLTAGPWMGSMSETVADLTVPERQVLGWFQPLRPELFTPAAFPVFNLLADEGHFYGFPVFGIPGFKIGKYHHLLQHVNPDTMDRESHQEDEAVLRELVVRYFPDANGPTMSLATCLFTNSPDEHFIVDLDPAEPRVALAAGFSGHGFKFCSVIGEILAELTLTGASQHDIGFLSARRFQAGVPA